MDYSTIPPDELVLVCLQAGDEQAWAEFVRRFHPLIARVVVRAARRWGEDSPQVIDDLVQDTYLKLCAERSHFLQNFKSAHKDAIYGYIKVFTANLVHDCLKASHSQKRGGATITTSIDDEEPSRSLMTSVPASATMDRTLLIQQVDACLQIVASGPSFERDRRIFWLYYRVGLTASAIAALPTIGLRTKGVESTLLRLTRQIRQRLSTRKEQESHGEISNEGIRPAESL